MPAVRRSRCRRRASAPITIDDYQDRPAHRADRRGEAVEGADKLVEAHARHRRSSRAPSSPGSTAAYDPSTGRPADAWSRTSRHGRCASACPRAWCSRPPATRRPGPARVPTRRRAGDESELKMGELLLIVLAASRSSTTSCSCSSSGMCPFMRASQRLEGADPHGARALVLVLTVVRPMLL